MNQLMILVLVLLSVYIGSLSCRFHEQNLSDVEQILVQSFKKKLLKELGFSSVPNVRNLKVPRIPSFYKRLIEEKNSPDTQNTEEVEDDFYAKTKRLFLFPEQVDSVTSGTKRNLIFKSNPRQQGLAIKSAFLWTHITNTSVAAKSDESKHEHKKPIQLRLYKSYKRSGKVFREKEHVHSVHLETAGWYTVDVTGIVQEWFSAWPKLDLSLNIAVEGTESFEIGGVSGVGGEPLQPFLAVETEEKQHVNKRKRRADSTQNCSLSSPCCRHDLVVKLHWHFIIAPREVNIYRCAGICKLPATSQYNADLQKRVGALRQHVARQPNPDLTSSACCTGAKWNPLEILFFNKDGDVEKKMLPDFTLASCHCIV